MSLLSSVRKVLKPKVIAAVVVPSAAFLISGALVFGGSTAAFSGTTSNAGNSWSAGTVALTDNHASALFSANGITPGYSETHCVTVTSTATVPTVLKMYTSAVTSTGTPTTLAANLNVQVQEGSGGTNTDGQTGGCTGFVPAAGQASTPDFSGTLAAFAGASSYASGVGSFNLPAAGSRQYQITVSLPSGVSNALQGTTAGATFQWEAQS